MRGRVILPTGKSEMRQCNSEITTMPVQPRSNVGMPRGEHGCATPANLAAQRQDGQPDHERMKISYPALQGHWISSTVGTAIYDPSDPMGKMFFNIVSTFAGFEADLLKMRTREGMATAKAKGKKPKLTEKQQKELWKMHETGDRSDQYCQVVQS